VFFSPSIEFPVIFALCLFLVIVGIPVGIARASLIGWIVGGLGMVCGDLVMLWGGLFW